MGQGHGYVYVIIIITFSFTTLTYITISNLDDPKQKLMCKVVIMAMSVLLLFLHEFIVFACFDSVKMTTSDDGQSLIFHRF